MRGHVSVSLFVTWLLVHPYFSDPDTGSWRRLWQAIWYRNTWVAVLGFDMKTECDSALQRAMAEAVAELKKTPPDPKRREANLAWAFARCVPADALSTLPFKVRAGDGFGLF